MFCYTVSCNLILAISGSEMHSAGMDVVRTILLLSILMFFMQRLLFLFLVLEICLKNSPRSSSIFIRLKKRKFYFHKYVSLIQIMGINMAVGINGSIGKPMIREGREVHVYVRRSLRDVFRKVPTFSLEVKVIFLL